tara:strand:+ start:1276 stop:1554 length:279 start_codon:yes stop_codon:yes gene_type:complete
LQFRIIVTARTLVRIGPAPVEYIFAVGIVFEIAGCDADQTLTIFDDDVLGEPAGLAVGRVRILQRREKTVRDERIFRAGAGVPVLRGHFVQR